MQYTNLTPLLKPSTEQTDSYELAGCYIDQLNAGLLRDADVVVEELHIRLAYNSQFSNLLEKIRINGTNAIDAISDMQSLMNETLTELLAETALERLEEHQTEVLISKLD